MIVCFQLNATRTIYQDKHLMGNDLGIRPRYRGSLKEATKRERKTLISALREEDIMAWMQGNGDDGTAGGGRWLTRLTGGMRKRGRGRLRQSVGAHVCRPSSCHPSIR